MGLSEVAVEVKEYAGVPRVEWPVTGGVPFGRGELAACASLELRDEHDTPVPLQTEALAHWEDGSVKWLLLDFFASMDPGEVRTYRLRYGDGVPAAADAPSSGLTWRATPRGISVDTGRLRATITPRFLDRLSIRNSDDTWTDVVSEPGEVWLSVDGENEGRYTAALDPEAEVTVEQSGPNRVCVRVSGWHYAPDGRRFGAFTLRVHAYAGKPYLRVFHTFTNSDLPERGLITGIGIRAPLAQAEKRAVNYGGEHLEAQGGWPCWLAQTDADTQEIVHDGCTLTADKPLEGFLAVRTDAATVACFVRNWRQLHPKKLEVSRRGLTAWLWPPSSGALDLRRQEQRQTEDWLWFKENYPDAYAEWIDPGTAKSAGFTARKYRAALRLRQMSKLAAGTAFGLARTHEMIWTFSPGPMADEEPGQISASLAEPLLPFVSPRHMDQTEALGRLGWQDRNAFPEVENHFLRKLDWIIRHQNEWARWWGIVDWGGLRSLYESLRDLTIPGQWLKYLGRHGWHNSETDIPVHIMYHYLRSGDRRVWHFFESIVRHQMDVDTIHLNHPSFEADGEGPIGPRWTRGGMHRHAYDHYAHLADVDHTWNESLANFYFLTGDRRAYDVALEVGEYTLGAPPGSNFDKYRNHPNEMLRFARSSANIYRNLMKCYELTGDPHWLQQALRSRRYFVSNSPRYLWEQPATFHVTTYLVRTFALDYHLFRDKAVGDEIVKIARWHCDHMRQGYDQRGLHYPYLACALAWWITRDDELLRRPWHTYLDECRSSTDTAQDPADFGKCHFYEFGQLPFFLRACQEAGYDESHPPRPPSDGAPADRRDS